MTSDSHHLVSSLLIAVGCILVYVNARRRHRQTSWRPFWKVGFSRREWAIHILGGVICLAGLVLGFTR